MKNQNNYTGIGRSIMQELPLVSVLMCIYKESIEWLQASIGSIVNQTYGNLQIVIVIDNPDYKEAEDLVKTYISEYPNITYAVNAKNFGLVKSLNIGLELCRGQYIARMDADDISDVTRIEKEVKFLIDNKLDLIGCRYFRFSDTYKEVTETVYSAKACRLILRYCPCMAHPTWLGKKQVFDVLGGYREIEACEDYDFAIRALKNQFKLGNIPETLFSYRDNQQSISHIKSGRQKVLTDYISERWRRKYIPEENEIKEYLNSDLFNERLKQYNQLSKKNTLLNGIFFKEMKKKIYIKIVKVIDTVSRKKLIF